MKRKTRIKIKRFTRDFWFGIEQMLIFSLICIMGGMILFIGFMVVILYNCNN